MKKWLAAIIFNLLVLFSSNCHATLNYSTYACTSWPCSPSTNPLSTGQVSTINYNWGGGQILDSGRSDQVAVKFTGYITWPQGTGQKTVTIYAGSDDSLQVKINDIYVINDWAGLHGMGYFNYANSITLTAGQTYAIEVWTAEWGGGAGVTLWWDIGNGAELIPASAYSTILPTTTIEGASGGITENQTELVNSARTRIANMSFGNSTYLDITGNGNLVNIEQTGSSNKIQGMNGLSSAVVLGDQNSITINQGDTLGSNLIEFSVTGSLNTINIFQARNASTGLRDSAESGGHYIGLSLIGNSNKISFKQGNAGNADSGHYAKLSVLGSNNDLSAKQSNNHEKKFFGSVAGDYNIFDITQQDSGNQYLDLTLVGNGHSVTTMQKDSGSHKATISLTNAGGSSTLTLVQQGSTNQSYSITQQCANLSGCSVNVTQGP